MDNPERQAKQETRHRKKKNKNPNKQTKNTTQKTKKMRNSYPNEKPRVIPGAREG